MRDIAAIEGPNTVDNWIHPDEHFSRIDIETGAITAEGRYSHSMLPHTFSQGTDTSDSCDVMSNQINIYGKREADYVEGRSYTSVERARKIAMCYRTIRRNDG